MSEYTIHVLSFIIGLAIIGVAFYSVIMLKEFLTKKHGKVIDKYNNIQNIINLSNEALEKIRLQQDMDKQEMTAVSEKLRDIIYSKKDTFLFQNILYCTLAISDIIDKCNIDNIYARRIKKNFDNASTTKEVVNNLRTIGLEAMIHKNHIIDSRVFANTMVQKHRFFGVHLSL